uniref:Uncharacterized protein n=1 Tax=Daucus carota subsp. sativus TaxID=79200 RepID=A0A162AHN3_DAUCS
MGSNAQVKQVAFKSNNTTVNVRWGSKEDATLVKSLLKLVDDGGWRAENGQLKSGAYGKLEKIMGELLPGCGMKARPHIESRVRLLRKQFFAIEEMRGPNCSGFGWNELEKSITCEKSIFEEWLKSHPNAKGLRNKSFPFYDELAQVFGKDRANGEGVESPADAVEEIANDEESNLYQQAGQQKDNLEDEVSPRNVQPTDTGARGSKRIKTDSLEIVKELTFGLQKISNVMETEYENIAKLTSCFQHESDGANKRMMVNSELLKIEGLSPDQFIKAGRKIALDPLETDYFFSLPEDYRSTYVQALLLPDS